MTFRLVRALAVLGLGAGLVVACNWDPSRPFEREAPQVKEALTHYDAGEADAAADLLEDYLTTGGCKEGNIGTPLRVRDRSNGSFDLGLSLFRIAETYGRRFGDEEVDAGPGDSTASTLAGLRSGHVECALRIVRAVAEDATQPLALRMHARYLEGNLLFLTAAYKEAVTAYDAALALTPAMGDAGPIGANPEAGAGAPYTPDGVARDAAWNRAVALRRIEDKKNDAGQDASSGDSGQNQDSPDSGQQNPDSGKNDQPDSGKNDKDKNKKDGGDDSNDKKNEPPPPEPDAGPSQPPPPSRQNQDDRILDQLENAPTVQQEAAKKQGRARRIPRGMVDK